jgi:Leucine-rich repeat (LRR) protein
MKQVELTESNDLSELVTSEPMPSLRILRISNNNLLEFDLSSFPRLRTLYADNNRLDRLARSSPKTVSRLENLSLRNQRGLPLCLSYDDLRDIKRLYISGKMNCPRTYLIIHTDTFMRIGNPLSANFFPSRALYSMAYLEAVACKLSDWPIHFAQRMPNLRHLNFNYNFLEDLTGLQGLQGLRKLSMIGGRLGATGTREVVSDLRGLGTLESVDLR